MIHKFEIISNSYKDTQLFGKKIGEVLNSKTVIGLIGDLGSGKTSFVQGLASGLDINSGYRITSPTFTIINEYLNENSGRLPLFHVDLYRINDASDLEETGFYDILDQEGVVAIEWADRLPKDILTEAIMIYFEISDDLIRKIQIELYGSNTSLLITTLQNIVL